MQLAPLTFKSIRARAVILKLKRPVVARIATITDWPLILVDLFTEEGIVGRSYLEPYTVKTMRYLVPALQDFGTMLKGRRVAPVELYDLARKSLHFVCYQGLSMIAVSGLDMAPWDALAKARGVPLRVLLGGSVGPVKAYNSNGLWLQAPARFVDFLRHDIYAYYGRSSRNERRSISELREEAAKKSPQKRGIEGDTLNRHLGYLGQIFDHAAVRGANQLDKIDLSKLRVRGKSTRARDVRPKLPLDSFEEGCLISFRDALVYWR
jgi:L-alanine-DL-glutamate epimerase-like enolase superfamily enzyme